MAKQKLTHGCLQYNIIHNNHSENNPHSWVNKIYLDTKMYSTIRRNEILIIRRDKDELISHNCVHDTSE